MAGRVYIAIDLKSFYASVECMDRGLDPLTTHLVVADQSRTEKTICLAVSPSLKAHGVPGRPRLFEVVQKVREVNEGRRCRAPGRRLTGSSSNATELAARPDLALDYIVAPPRMAHYVECSTRIYQVYLSYIAPEDIHVYSIDEVFIDATGYLDLYGLTAHELAQKMILDVLAATGVTATAGIGTNLYLAKVAMDVWAKHVAADENGVRIAELDEMSYRRLLWTHEPLTDFWRVGPGYARKLEANGIRTMGDIARCSVGAEHMRRNENLLYRLFGKNAELLIDHAWGWEPVTMAQIKAYRPQSSSVGSGQVLMRPYAFDEARLVLREMAELLAMDLVRKRLTTDQLVITVGYDIENLAAGQTPAAGVAACVGAGYTGEVTVDAYGRKIPKHAHGTANVGRRTSSSRLIMDCATELFDRIVDRALLVRRLNIVAAQVQVEDSAVPREEVEQLDLLTDYAAQAAAEEARVAELARERRRQEAVLGIKERFGKNAILRGMNLEDGATAKSRNAQIGGHRA